MCENEPNMTIVFRCVTEAGKKDGVKIHIENCCEDDWEPCFNGQCIEPHRFCDGVKDCYDGSDEDPVACEGRCRKTQSDDGTIESVTPVY